MDIAMATKNLEVTCASRAAMLLMCYMCVVLCCVVLCCVVLGCVVLCCVVGFLFQMETSFSMPDIGRLAGDWVLCAH